MDDQGPLDLTRPESGEISGSYTPPHQRRGGITGFLLKTGIVKNERQAQLVLISIAILALLLTFGIAWNTWGPEYQAPSDPGALSMNVL
jgi:hypothetical protein